MEETKTLESEKIEEVHIDGVAKPEGVRAYLNVTLELKEN